LLYLAAWERGFIGGAAQLGTSAYGAIRAIDPRTGDKKWEFRRNDAVFTSGVLTTASDLVFTGVWGDFYSESAAARRADRYFYALDARTGERLWQMALSGSVEGSPMSYSVDGTQYVAVAAGNTLFAFSLRE
jgi:alcohol dehydrogenase (cytochrome c)